MPAPQELLQTAVQAAHAAADLLRELATQPRQVHEKGYLDIVTDGDLAADQAIQGVILRDWPGHHLLSEEDEAARQGPWQPSDGYWWLVDPIDGTTNFARGLPSWSISIACGQGEQLLAGVVFDVARDDLYAAAQGSGATRNGDSIFTNQRAELAWAMCLNDYPVAAEIRAEMIGHMTRLLPQIRALRCWGTTALGLAHVAAGFADAYFHNGFHVWDVAAGVLLVQEAGGLVTGFDGTPWRLDMPTLLASNRPLQPAFVQILSADTSSA
ncbi:MAG: hypothetical protein HC915_03920 [Anaerolineae bacterium]|nr:hypothetical protein [Anaerolineae bacterium]